MKIFYLIKKMRLTNTPCIPLAFLDNRLYNHLEKNLNLDESMSRSNQLYELQSIDSKLDINQKRLREIEKILADRKEIKKKELQLHLADDELKIVSKALREAEIKVQKQRLKLKQTETKLYGGKIRNPKELQDLQDESQALIRFLNTLEDRQLERMLEVDDKKDQVHHAQKSLDEAIEKASQLRVQLTIEKEKILRENQSLETKRIDQMRVIDPKDLAIYKNLRKHRFGVAVSKVNERACSACGATLTAALAQSARSPSQIAYCETCGRILTDDL
jgi:hypothetical protein